jgi:hypothetical protein
MEEERARKEAERKARRAAYLREKRASDPEYREKQNELMRRKRSDPEYRKKCNERQQARVRERYANDTAYREKCREQARRARRKQAADPIKRKEISAEKRVKKYGMSQSDLAAMREECGGKCQVCGKDMIGTRREHIDHCHATGRVRGLICPSCNRAIGLFRDSPEIAMSAALYLERHAALARAATQERAESAA